MQYLKTIEARFISRPNRFIAQVELDGKIETVHVKNTGRCKELLLPNSQVILSEADNPARKTRYNLIAVEKPDWGLSILTVRLPIKSWLSGWRDRTTTMFSRNILTVNPALTSTWSEESRNICWKSRAVRWNVTASDISPMRLRSGV